MDANKSNINYANTSKMLDNKTWKHVRAQLFDKQFSETGIYIL